MENKLEIITNNKYREILSFYDLTEKEQMEIKDNYDTIEDSSFFRYKGNVYDLSDIMRMDKNSSFPSFWHGYSSESFFSGILVHISDDGDCLIVASYYS